MTGVPPQRPPRPAPELQDARTTRRASRWPLAATLALTLVGCAGSHGNPNATSGSSGPAGGTTQGSTEHAAANLQCSESWRTDAPPLDAAPPLAWPTSRLSVTARVPISTLVDELSRRVPERLATHQRRSIGAAGRATYSVRRGTPRIVARDETLEVQVPIEATVDVCKPFGSSCFRYGSCRPAFLATFRVANALDEDYRISPPRGSLEATRRCVIGIDVTPRILGEARKEIQKIERSLQRSLPDLEGEVRRLWQTAQTEERIGEDTCLRFVPETLSHSPARLTRDQLELDLGLSGDLRVGSCDSGAAPVPLPKLREVAHGASGSEVNLPRRVHFHAVAEAIEEQLALDDGTELGSLEVTAHGPRLALRLGLQGASCGDVWLSALPTFDPASGELSLTDVRAEAPTEGAGADIARQLVRSLGAVRGSTPIDTERVAQLIQGWLRRARQRTRGVDFDLTFAPPSRGRARVHSEGILVTSVIEPQATLRATALAR